MNISKREFEESRSRSFTNLWQVAKDYRIENGVVIPTDTKDMKKYMSMSRPELPAEFAKVAADGSEEILRFVRRYGLPGYHQAWSFRELPGVVGLDPNDLKVKGDPVHWILSHAANVKLVAELAEAIQDPSRLKVAVEKLIVGKAPEQSLAFKMAGRASAYPASFQMRLIDDRRECALQIISHVLNDNLTGVFRGLIVEYNKAKHARGLTSVFVPRNLLDCIYWHLADAVLGGTFRACAKCGRFFVATHRRMKYCPPPMGQLGVSRCMDAAKHQPKKQKRQKRRKKHGNRQNRGRHIQG
jgi:hypothetical protein